MREPLYWIGIRSSELQDIPGFFAGSVTMFGPGQDGNRSFERRRQMRHDYNQESAEWVEFVERSAEEILQQTPNGRFMIYSPEEAECYGQAVAQRAVCQNPQPLLDLLEDKFQTRQWLSDYVPILPYRIQPGETLSYAAMLRHFPGFKRFVIQASFSCGGSGTWLVTEDNHTQILSRLDPEAPYAVSAYQENSVSPNIHLVIYDQEVLLLPPSIQLVEAGEDGFCYRGADFPMYRSLPGQLDVCLKRYAQKIGDVLRRAGYRGVCGVDFLIADDTIYLMEVNPRFQSSTFLLNRALREAGYECSLQSLQLDAFEAPAPDDRFRGLSSLAVPYSCYHYEYQPGRKADLRYVWNLLKHMPDAGCIDDGLDWAIQLEPHTYLYKGVFRGSIAALAPPLRCRLHANMGLAPASLSAEALRQDLERLKIMLLSRGVRLSGAAAQRLEHTGGFNHEEFWALDLVLNGHIYICAPYDTNRSELSPFCVEADEGSGYFLSCYGKYVLAVQVRAEDAIGDGLTSRGIPYHDITYLGNDRLRVYHRPGCCFKDLGTGCGFCDIPKDNRIFTLEDIFQALDAYRDHPAIRHYLIGGGSNPPDDDFSVIESISKHIRDTTGKPIYLMSLPPRDAGILARLKQAGITEVAFNLEVFDRSLARRYMPGKGAISLTTYEDAFRAAVELWGRTGNVRTIFIVGLEPAESLLEGVAHVAEMGVSPILSLLRPIEETPLRGLLAPRDEEVWEIYQAAKAICARQGVSLGPACPCCEDNTLKISL